MKTSTLRWSPVALGLVFCLLLLSYLISTSDRVQAQGQNNNSTLGMRRLQAKIDADKAAKEAAEKAKMLDLLNRMKQAQQNANSQCSTQTKTGMQVQAPRGGCKTS